jgi:pimeloyl-ACP methyl ester carboxylesterase
MAVSSKFFRIAVVAAALLAAGLIILLLWGSFGTKPAAAAPSNIVETSFFVETSDDISIHVREKSPGGGTSKVPVLLVHGLWGNSQTWDFPGRSVMDHLAERGYDVYALDMRGMGESESPRNYGKLKLLDRVKDLEAVASHIKNTTGRRPVVAGWSQGGALTGVLAASRPDLVEGVGLFSVPANGFFVSPQFEEILAQLIERKVDRYLPPEEIIFDNAFGFDPVTGSPTISAGAFDTFYSMLEPDSVRVMEELFSPEFFQATVSPSWSRIRAPALVVGGAQDLGVSEESAIALYNALSSENKDLIIFPQNAHGWFLEDNHEATQSLAFDEFLAQFD